MAGIDQYLGLPWARDVWISFFTASEGLLLPVTLTEVTH